MEWSEVLDPELSPREVICERIPEMHADRIEQFGRLCDTSLIFSIVFDDGDQRYTLSLSPEGARGVEGDMIDFPQATARGRLDSWSRSMALLSELVEPADRQIDGVEERMTVDDAIKRGFEQFDGVLDVEIVNIPDGEGPLSFEIILNDYSEPSWAETAELSVDWSTLEDVANGRIGPVEAAQQVRLRSAVGLAVDLGGFLMNEFDL